MNLQDIIIAAYAEDLPREDVTTKALQVENFPGQARLLAKEDLVLSGREVFAACLQHVAFGTEIKWYFEEGQVVLNGQTICVLRGNLIAVLKAERVALNFLGHLSGIATLTRCFVKAVETTRTKILHTRKTLPLWRDLEIAAVVHGGGHRHRRDLSSAILLKENHIRVAGSIAEAVAKSRSAQLPIEVEVRDLAELKEAIAARPDRIMLDNFNDRAIQDAIELIPATIEVEASGNMTIERAGLLSEMGVEFLSVGKITHSAPAADVSLLFDWNKK